MGVFKLQKEYASEYLYSKKKVNYQNTEKQFKTEAVFLKQMPSFGYNNLIADWSFLKYIQYFGDTKERDKTGYSVITDYFEAIVKKDPRFVEANLSLSAANSIFAARPEKTISLLEKSSKFLSPNMQNHPYMIFVYKAVDEILFFGNLEAAQKSYLEAARWAEKDSAVNKNVVQRFRKTVNFLATNPDSSYTQVAGWSMILRANNDPKIQRYAIEKIKKLGGKIIVKADGEIIVKPPK